MKLGELCKVINGAMFIKYSNNKGEDKGFWVHGISFQQKLHRCKDFARWDVVAISDYPSEPNKVIVEIAKLEEEEYSKF